MLSLGTASRDTQLAASLAFLPLFPSCPLPLFPSSPLPLFPSSPLPVFPSSPLPPFLSSPLLPFSPSPLLLRSATFLLLANAQQLTPPSPPDLGHLVTLTSTNTKDNIEKILERGEKLDDLVEKSNDLTSQSKIFYKQARAQNSCCIVM